MQHMYTHIRIQYKATLQLRVVLINDNVGTAVYSYTLYNIDMCQQNCIFGYKVWILEA